MPVQLVNRVSSIFLIVFSLIALLTVASGYVRSPQPADAREYIFQLSIVALVPMTLLFLATSDLKQPLRSARPLAFAVATSAVAFAGLYFLEHYR
jgi:membrane protease YdiL (CAAX protease family)